MVDVTNSGMGGENSIMIIPMTMDTIQGWSSMVFIADFLSTSVNSASPEVHMVILMGSWNMDTYTTPRLPYILSATGIPIKLELEHISP